MSIEDLPIKKQNLDIWNENQKHSYFYKDKNDNYFPYYKEDIIKYINVFKPYTFLPIFKALDIPFYENKWLDLIKKAMTSYYRLNPSLSYIFSHYLLFCKSSTIKQYGFKNSDRFFNDNEKDFEYIPEIEIKF